MNDRVESLRKAVQFGIENGKKNLIVEIDVLNAMFHLGIPSEIEQYDPMKYLIEANRDEILRKHEEAVRRIQRCLKRCEYDLADKVIEALWKFHPMHCESWCGWPEGTDE